MATNGVAEWLAAFARTATSVQRDDMHIDRLDARLRDRSRWVDGGLSVLREAREVCAAEDWAVTVAVEFFLTSHAPAAGLTAANAQDLGGELSWTPPALTAYKRGSEPWRSGPHFAEVTAAFDPALSAGGRVFFQEGNDEDEEDYDRRLWVVGEPPPSPPGTAAGQV